ncbi:MAG: septal ring lytic transglycosylase RlpA family protein, partial [Actinomycetota bacterium]|nr:septal ring lytic transglycosylase RlpA family protein [Actinomycetota bacterium]
VAAAVLVSVAAATLPRAAGATDISELRRRAQTIADEVSALEHRRARLEARSNRLEREVTEATAELGTLELEIHRATAAVTEAHERYVARAVEAYKSGPTTRLALLLSARSLGELISLTEATYVLGASESDALAELLDARDSLEATQDRVDARKQTLLAIQEEARTLANEVADTVASRRVVLRKLTNEIQALERQARAAAEVAAAAQGVATGAAFLRLLEPAGPAPDIPAGFASTGVSFEGVASWYGPGFEGNLTASGDVFDSSLYTVASKELPLRSWLYVEHEGRGVVVYVNDRGPYVGDRILDLSHAAAQAIGITGLGWVKATIIVKK